MNISGQSMPDIGLYAFWDIDKNKLDFFGDKEFIISRMFERGKFDDVLKIVSFYGVEESKQALITNKYLSRPGMYLAHTILGIPIEYFAAYASHQHH